MEHSQQVFGADREPQQRCHLRVSGEDRFGRVTEFCSEEEIEKQVKQNYKHVAHLLDSNNHFVVPVIDSLGWETVADLEMVAVKMPLWSGTVIAGMMVAVVVRTAVGRAAAAGHKVAAEEEDSARSQRAGAAQHILAAESLAPAVDCTFVEPRMSSTKAEAQTVVDSWDMQVIDFVHAVGQARRVPGLRLVCLHHCCRLHSVLPQA